MALKPIALAVSLALAGAAAAETQKLAISAGDKAEPTHAFAQHLCAIVNAQKRLNLACEVRETAGDVASLQSLDGEEAQIAFGRSDRLEQAAAGTGPFRDRGPMRGSGRERRGGPNEDLRSLFTLNAETLAILARADSGIKSTAELKGRRVNIGPPGSGQRTLFELIAPALGLAPREFSVAAELKAADQGDALCRGRVDAVLYLAAQPDNLLRNAAQACETIFVPVAGREIETLDRDKTYLLRAPIPGGLYKSTPRDVPSIGFAIVAASSTKVDARLVYEAVKAVFDNLARLQRADPIYARLDAKRMTGDGLALALHDGAAKLFRERGWIR